MVKPLDESLQKAPQQKKIRVRYAPSPTGYLHVGGARSALINYIFAKKQGGDFILRIEDTDNARSTLESAQVILEDLLWLGITWDEGPTLAGVKAHDKRASVGAFGPYFQSERLEIYQQHIDRLLKEGRAYYCFLTEKEIEEQKAKLKSEGLEFEHIQSPYADWSLEKALAYKKEKNLNPVVRFNKQRARAEYKMQDLIRGEVVFPSSMVGDFVLMRSDAMPVYNFSCVVDDALMEITHVLRGEEHLPNTLRQLMLYEALGFALPSFGHLALILNEERQKLSKRHGSVACSEFRADGYLPEALVNFLCLMGWGHPEGKEIFSLSEIMADLELKDLSSSGAVFDRQKLKWLNAQYIHQLSDSGLVGLVKPFLEQEFSKEQILLQDEAWLLKALGPLKHRMETLKDAHALFTLLLKDDFLLEPEALEVLDWEKTPLILKSWLSKLKNSKLSFLTLEDFNKIQDEIKDELQVKGKFLFMPLRVALVGKAQGVDLKDLVPLIPLASLIKRAQRVCDLKVH